ncbi:hypothetical protein EBT31_22695 [bacterium]|nr:hypothetical protein [bacterium]
MQRVTGRPADYLEEQRKRAALCQRMRAEAIERGRAYARTLSEERRSLLVHALRAGTYRWQDWFVQPTEPGFVTGIHQELLGA